ncbi:response regulator transcription factor [Glycomyces sp. A-F 0318]|uniref:response regulator transcription factor n=1 Tax=Glycomyces amatae TaxID=2881355 RepID=UPI001E533E71|nr:response regulator transcription factor [Glycomyces amatae]MCD0445542.1 response regulator transcription factor [Glycomyces amatae]
MVSTAETNDRVLVVDEEDICALLSATLRLTGFDVRVARSAAEALAAADEFEPDLVVLDAVLPGMDGFAVAERLRAERDLPVLLLTARDRATGDDHVTEPFDLEAVVLRVQAVLRRTKVLAPSAGSVLRYADLELDETVREVRRAGRPIELSPTEFKLLRYLMVNAGKVVSKSQILDRVWDCDVGGNGRLVESYVYYLRKKIDATGPRLIQTVRGFGYALREPRAR